MIGGELEVWIRLTVDIDYAQVTRKADNYFDYFALMFDADAMSRFKTLGAFIGFAKTLIEGGK